MDERLAEAADIVALVRQQAALLARELDVEVGAHPVALDARESLTRREETPLGRFFAELLRDRVGAQVGLLNSGAIRGNRRDPARARHETDVHAAAALQQHRDAARGDGGGPPGRARALGGRAAAAHRPLPPDRRASHTTVDPARPPGRRVGASRSRGGPLDPAGLYRVAVPDYLARGKDGYAMLAASRVLLAPEDGPGLIETVLDGLAAGRSPPLTGRA